MNLGKVICFAYSDSSVDYRDRATMSETFNDGDLDRVWHLSQIGFSYAEDEPCKGVAHARCVPQLISRRLAIRPISQLLFCGTDPERWEGQMEETRLSRGRHRI